MNLERKYFRLFLNNWKNKPEQAIELHGNPKEKIKMYEIRKMFESDRLRAKPDPRQNQ